MVDIADGRLRRDPGPLAAFVLGGLTSLVPLGRARGAAAALLVVVPAATVGTLVAVGQERERAAGAAPAAAPARTWGSLPSPVAPVLAGTFVGVASALGLLLDRVAETALRRRTRHPRLVLALVGAVGSALVAVLERRRPAEDAGPRG